jgi:hypothetical protein
VEPALLTPFPLLHGSSVIEPDPFYGIQRIKQRACGFRNKERFRNAIYFQLGGLDLYPAGIKTG